MAGILNSNYASSCGLQVKSHAKMYAKKVGFLHYGMQLRALSTVCSKPQMMLNPKNMHLHVAPDLGFGSMVKDGFVYRQNFHIKSYEIGPSRTILKETIMNYMQEATLNHLKTIGLLGDGLGSTPNMCKKNLIWVMTKVQMVVDRYPSWGDVVQIDTWIATSGKNGMHSNWIFCDCETGEILIRVKSFWAMMNKETRRLSKFPDEVRVEMKQYLMDTPPIAEEVTKSWPSRNGNIANNTRYGLTPRWSDLDINQHVNNVKYIGWILESVPMPILESYELASMTLEYRRECKKDSVLESQTYVLRNDENGEIAHDNHVYCQHVLRLDDGGRRSGSEIMKGKTRWRSKYGSN